MATRPRTCDNGDCEFGKDERCIEGLSLDECPHLRRISINDIPEVAEEEAPVAKIEEAIELDSGEPLDREAASDLQCRRLSRSIGLIGPNDSGKTSLFAGLYDLLQCGSISGVAFAGSSTLIGFEKVCHLARAASRRATPHTERTSAGLEATFFHLDLRPDGGEVLSLFIGDRSGEDYLGATDELSRADEFFEIRRADCVTLLVNGEQLVDAEKRHEVKAMTPQIVDALIEAGAVRAGCRLAVVLTKKDAVITSQHAERATREFDALVAAIGEAHGGHLGEVRAFTVAASPKGCEQVTRGEGVAELLLFWLEEAPVSSVQNIQSRAAMPRMIDRFGHAEELSQ